jgi:hypothetical protein
MDDTQYWVMDGRAHYSFDDATVLVCCDSLDEAKSYINDYGAGTCIIEVNTKTWEHSIVASLLWIANEQNA